MNNKMKAHEYIPTTIILLTGLLCVTKLIGMFPFDWIWVFVLIWGPILAWFGLVVAVAVLVLVWLALSEMVTAFTGEEV